jgi:hypothetical protein
VMLLLEILSDSLLHILGKYSRKAKRLTHSFYPLLLAQVLMLCELSHLFPWRGPSVHDMVTGS